MGTSSGILTYLGLGNIDIFWLFLLPTCLCAVLLILVIALFVSLGRLKKKYARFMRGKEAGDLETEIAEIFEDNKKLKESADDNRRNIRRIFYTLEHTFQKIGVVKYDAFSQMGGGMSFSLALLDEKDNGVLINTVHSIDSCYSYLKEIRAGECEIALGDEEKRALDIAAGRISGKEKGKPS